MKLKFLSEGWHLAAIFIFLLAVVSLIFYFTPPVLSGN